MLFFHEGLPRSGKSFAAVKDHIIPALQNGRKVFAYVEGLNPEKIAEVAEMTPESVQALLFHIEREQVPDIWKHVDNDALVVIDELQNFWPNGRQKLSPEITEFVTEHGHRGLDVLCMGQVLGDCHALWRRRMENKTAFSKLSALGAEDRYTWALYKQVQPDKWEKTTSGTAKYDPKYFGTYKSHTDGTTNTGNYKDARAVIWNNPVLRYGIPGAFAIAALGIWYVVDIFRTGDIVGSPEAAPPQAVRPEPVRVQESVYKIENGQRVLVSQSGTPVPVAPKPVPHTGLVPTGHIADLTSANRVRLAGVILSAKPRIILEWRDGGGRVVEQMEASDIQALGWHVMLAPSGGVAILTNGTDSHVVTPWPIEEVRGTVPESINDRIRTGV
jgi:zona occludens toxin